MTVPATRAAEATNPMLVPRNSADAGATSSRAAARVGESTDSRSEAKRDSDSAEVNSSSSGSASGITDWNVGVNVAEADCSTKTSA